MLSSNLKAKETLRRPWLNFKAKIWVVSESKLVTFPSLNKNTQNGVKSLADLMLRTVRDLKDQSKNMIFSFLLLEETEMT